MVSRNSLKYCCEDISLIENYEKALNDKSQIWHCHHRKESEEGYSDEELKEIGLYYNRPADELIFLTAKEHKNMHGSWNKGIPCSKETKTKIATAKKGKIPWNKGKKMDDEFRKKVSESCKGKQLSDEHKQKLSEKFKGRVFSDEHKAKISAACKGRKKTETHKEKLSQSLKTYNKLKSNDK